MQPCRLFLKPSNQHQSDQNQLYMIYFHKEIKSPFKKHSDVFKDNDHVNQREAKEKSRVAANLGNHAEIWFSINSNQTGLILDIWSGTKYEDTLDFTFF